MIFSVTKEISALYPTSKWNKIESLLPLLNDEEHTTLTPFLGSELHAFMQSEYARLIDQYSLSEEGLPGIHLLGDATPQDLRTAQLLQHMQSVTFYSLLSHNRSALSNSFNAGGGFNRMSAGDYDPSDTQNLHDLDREFFANMHRKIDLMLRALEYDALLPDASEEEPEAPSKPHSIWRKMWQQSTYFYLKSDLIFTRADVMNEYHNIESSREKYIKLVPDLRFIQQTIVEPRIGQSLLRSIIRSQTDPKATESLVIRAKRITTPADQEPLPPTEFELGECSEQATYALNLLRMATAQYLRWRTEKDRTLETKTDGDLCLAQAANFISSCNWLNPQPPAAPQPEEEEQPGHKHEHHHHGHQSIFVFGSAKAQR